MNFLAVTGRVRSDLGSFLSRAARAFKVLTNLLASGAGCVEIFLCVSLDLRSTAPSCSNFVAKLSEAVSQLGLIDRRGKLLGGEEALRLNCARLAIVALRDIENDRACMQLWRDIAIDRAGGIVLELGGYKFASGLGLMIAADAGGQRDGFGRGKGCIPTGTVFHRLDGLAVGILIFIGRSLSQNLLAGLWMLTLAEFRKVLGGNGPGKAELPDQSPLPLTRDDAALRPIVLFLRGELCLVVGLRLSGGERF